MDVVSASRNTVSSGQEDTAEGEIDEEEEWPDVIGEVGDLPM